MPKKGKAKAPKKTRMKWTESDDKLLLLLVNKYGRRWSIVASHIPGRNDGTNGQKRCRERYINHLCPDVNKSRWTKEEDKKLKQYYIEMGAQWRTIARKMKGRTEIQVKNRCNTKFKKEGVKPKAGIIRQQTDKVGRKRKTETESKAQRKPKRASRSKSNSVPKAGVAV